MDDLELALDDCLQQLASGTSSLGQCLARYPRYAAELRPLLETALRLQQTRSIRPSGAMRDRARAELTGYMKTHPRRPRMKAIPKLATSMIVISLALASVGTAVAQAALPGQALYGVKLYTERAWRAANPDPVAADLTLANRRTMELIALTAKSSSGPKDDVLEASAESQAIAAYADVLSRLADETNGPSASQILSALEDHQQALSNAGIHVPELDDIVAHAQSAKDKGQGHGQGNKP